MLAREEVKDAIKRVFALRARHVTLDARGQLFIEYLAADVSGRADEARALLDAMRDLGAVLSAAASAPALPDPERNNEALKPMGAASSSGTPFAVPGAIARQ